MGRPFAPGFGNPTNLRGIRQRVRVRGGRGPAPPPNDSTRRHQHQDTHATRRRRTTPTHHGQAGTSTGATAMGFDQYPKEQETPLGTPFDDGFTPSTTRGYTSADPTGGAHTENFFTPLYTESQETDHINVNTNQKRPTPAVTRNAKMASASASATAEAKASAVAEASEAAEASPRTYPAP